MKEKFFGLSPIVIAQICEVLMAHPKVERIVLYGSRAKGSYRPGSDIDLVLFGDQLSTGDLLSLERQIDDLMLPYKLDLSIFSQIDNKKLIEHIENFGVPFQSS